MRRNVKIDYPNEYAAWQNMIQRCTNPKRPNYHNYGGRGIKVCDRWKNSFKNFLEDMGIKPDAYYTIDRNDNDGNYEPGNCSWELPIVNNHNKRDRKDNILNKTKAYIIRELYKTGNISQMELAKMFNLSQMHISNVINNKYWK